jgi:glycosyltransferase involved in cell wall biosynthesis
MRVLHVILSSGFAGSERYVADLANEQARTGHAVRVVVASGHRDAQGRSVVDALSPQVTWQAIPRWFLSGRALAQVARDFAPDVLHAHLRKATRRVAALRAWPWRLRLPALATLHIRYNHPIYLRMDALVCNADWQLQEIPAHYRGRVQRLDMLLAPYPPVTPERVQALRQELGAGDGHYLIGVVGRLTREKGVHLLVEALQRAGLPQARLAILGDGREAAALRSQLTSQMRLPGFRHDVKDCYAAFDLLVCPTLRMESGPLVLLEAWQAGTPVLASDLGGCRELVRRHGGQLFPPGDVEALAQQLRDCHAAGRQRHPVDLSSHRIDAVSRQVTALYESLVAHHAA